MLVVLSPIFVANTKITFVYNFVAPLKTSKGTIVGHLKKGKSGRFAKAIFYYLRSHPQANCTAKVTGKRFNLGDGEGL